MRESHRLVIAHGDREELLKLRNELKKAGYTICGATTDGDELVRLTRRERPELVIMTLELAYMDGLEALRRMKPARELIKCLVLADSDGKALEQAVAAGASGALLMPYSNHALLEKVALLVKPENRPLTEKEAELAVANAMEELRAPTYLKGYRYMFDALVMILLDSEILRRRNVTREVYGVIAQRYGATPEQVERAMRSLTHHILERTEEETLARYLMPTDIERKRVANTRFMDSVAAQIRRAQRKETLESWRWA